VSDTAFVICQVGPEDSEARRRADEIYEFIVGPAVNEFKLKPTRADLDPTPGQVTAQIVRSLTGARVVIADLTGRNPNVYYELGVAHAFGIPVVILVDAAASLSFDTSAERVIEIGKGERLGVSEAAKAKERLRAALGVVLKDGYEPKSLVSEAAGTRSLDALAPENPVAQELAHVRDRLEVVIQQTSPQNELTKLQAVNDGLREELGQLLRVMRDLGKAGVLTREAVASAGINLDHAISRERTREFLSEHIKDRPLPNFSPQMPDFTAPTPDFGSPPPRDDEIPF
jgi:hypothetical protein